MVSRSKEAVEGTQTTPTNSTIGRLKAKLTRMISIIAQTDGEENTSSSNEEYKTLVWMLNERFITLEVPWRRHLRIWMIQTCSTALMNISRDTW